MFDEIIKKSFMHSSCDMLNVLHCVMAISAEHMSNVSPEMLSLDNFKFLILREINNNKPINVSAGDPLEYYCHKDETMNV